MYMICCLSAWDWRWDSCWIMGLVMVMDWYHQILVVVWIKYRKRSIDLLFKYLWNCIDLWTPLLRWLTCIISTPVFPYYKFNLCIMSNADKQTAWFVTLGGPETSLNLAAFAPHTVSNRTSKWGFSHPGLTEYVYIRKYASVYTCINT